MNILNSLITTQPIRYFLVDRAWYNQRHSTLMTPSERSWTLVEVESLPRCVVLAVQEKTIPSTLEPVEVDRNKLRAGLTRWVYADIRWDGPTVAENVDERISFDWNLPESRPVPYQFSVLWEGYLEVPEDGVYHFWIASDDGSWVTLNSIEILANPGIHAADVERYAKFQLKKGFYKIRIKFFDVGFGCALNFMWSTPTMEKNVLSSPYLWHLPPD
jgi:hypothetical protein